MTNKLHHIWYLLDESGSMGIHQHTLPKVMDAQIRNLAEDSKNHPGEETRVSVFGFSSKGGHANGKPLPDYECMLYDMDVLHVPSIEGMYRIIHGTALCDAMIQLIGDIRLVPEKYGEHFHLVYLLSDGEELHSTWEGRAALPKLIAGLPGNITIAGFVPSVTAKHYLTRHGFSPGNIEIWDPSKADAPAEVGVAMAASTSGYMSMTRSGGGTSTQNLFSMAAPKAGDLKKALTPLTPGSYYFEEITAADLSRIENGRIDQFMSLKTGKPYIPGRAYYEMISRVRIQHYKTLAVAILDKPANTEIVCTGANARQLLGLPDDGQTDVRVSPGNWNSKGYKVYILSASSNRKLVPGTRLLVMR